MWRKPDEIAARCLRLMHVSTNAASAILTLYVRCIASVDAKCVMRTRKNVVQKSQSRCKEDAREKPILFDSKPVAFNDILKKRGVVMTSEVEGDAPWLEPIPAICPAEIPVPSAASRSRDRIGSRAVQAARRSSGSAAPAIIALKRSRSMKRRIRTHSPPDLII